MRELYVLEQLHVPSLVATSVDLFSFRLSSQSSEFYLWHSRLSHISSFRLQYLVSISVLGNCSTQNISDCSGCKLAEFIALPFNKNTTISSTPFDLVHSYV